MANGFRLSVDQVVAAIEILDPGEQAELRMRLLGWLAGASLGSDVEPQPSRIRPAGWTPQPASDDDELYLYDELMALTDE